MLDIDIAVSKINKYASRESGDTVEVVERPEGGFSALIVDGQGSGRASKLISQIVAAKALGLIKDGARDGVVARAAHDYLFLQRGGKVSATLTLCSVDLAAQALVLTRNSHCPIALQGPPPAGLRWLDAEVAPAGLYRHTRPAVHTEPLAAGTWVIAFSDGILEAGRREGEQWDVRAAIAALLPAPAETTARALADSLLAQAMAQDAGRPQDDMSVVVLGLREAPDRPPVRRLDLRVPVE